MAKKKANTQSKNNPKNPRETPTDDAVNPQNPLDVSEQLHILKSLNSMLIKETADRRQQVRSLESELSEYASLRSELNRLSERLLALEIENGVASRAFTLTIAELEELNRSQRVEMAEKNTCLESRLDQAMKEKTALERQIAEEKCILSSVSEERDANRALMERQIRIENGLKLKLAEAEKKKAVGLEELRKVRADYDGLVKEKTELESENTLYRAALDQATVERDGALVSLEGEKVKVKELTMNISMVEKKLQDTQEKLSKTQQETKQLAAQNKGLENTRAEMENKILAVKKSLAEDDDQEAEFGEEIKDIVTETEAIKKSCKDKESHIEELTKQLDMLKACAVRADKWKGFWRMVSSATAILAAVSFACVARGGKVA